MRPNTDSLITVMDLPGAALEEASRHSERVHASIFTVFLKEPLARLMLGI